MILGIKRTRMFLLSHILAIAEDCRAEAMVRMSSDFFFVVFREPVDVELMVMLCDFPGITIFDEG